MRDKIGKKKVQLPYVILFSLLCLIIVVLIICIIIVTNTNQNNAESDEPVNENSTSLEEQVSEEVSDMLKESNVDFGEIEKKYDDYIAKASNNNPDTAIRIIIQKLLFIIVDEEDCAKAKEYTNSLDTSSYSDNQKLYLQSYIDSALSECNNEGEEN